MILLETGVNAVTNGGSDVNWSYCAHVLVCSAGVTLYSYNFIWAMMVFLFVQVVLLDTVGL